jgi:hypothetical protein
VGPTLPALKSILETNVPLNVTESSYSRLVHGLVSCCLQNIDETRFVYFCRQIANNTSRRSGRSGLVVTMKAKNNLFTSVLVLTILPPSMNMSRALIEQCCYLISQRLAETSDVCTAFHALSRSNCAIVDSDRCSMCQDNYHHIAYSILQPSIEVLCRATDSRAHQFDRQRRRKHR